MELQLWYDGGITACCGLRRGRFLFSILLLPSEIVCRENSTLSRIVFICVHIVTKLSSL